MIPFTSCCVNSFSSSSATLNAHSEAAGDSLTSIGQQLRCPVDFLEHSVQWRCSLRRSVYFKEACLDLQFERAWPYGRGLAFPESLSLGSTPPSSFPLSVEDIFREAVNCMELCHSLQSTWALVRASSLTHRISSGSTGSTLSPDTSPAGRTSGDPAHSSLLATITRPPFGGGVGLLSQRGSGGRERLRREGDDIITISDAKATDARKYGQEAVATVISLASF